MVGCRYASGAKYEGAWKANVKHGHGIFYYTGGGSFEGEFVNGKRSGMGVRLWPHGAAKVLVSTSITVYYLQSVFLRCIDLPRLSFH